MATLAFHPGRGGIMALLEGIFRNSRPEYSSLYYGENIDKEGN
jgi:hypothetical protein